MRCSEICRALLNNEISINLQTCRLEPAFSIFSFIPTSSYTFLIYEKYVDFRGLKKYHLSIRERNIAESLYFYHLF